MMGGEEQWLDETPWTAAEAERRRFVKLHLARFREAVERLYASLGRSEDQDGGAAEQQAAAIVAKVWEEAG